MGRVNMHLSPSFYDSLQRFVHGSYDETIAAIVSELGLRPGDLVVEIGCGTGGLSRYLTDLGYEYWGVEPDEERVATARSNNPAGHFLNGYAEAIQGAGLPPFDRAFVHGMIHHIDDEAAKKMLDQVFAIPGMRLVMIEPILPRTTWLNPFGYMLAKMDEGEFVRTREAMEALCGTHLRKSSVRSLMPRWPVPFVHLTLEALPAV